MKNFKSYRLGESLLLALVCSASTFLTVADERFSPYVDNDGNISSPEDFRGNMVHLGSWFVPEGDASGFHDVYTEKTTVDAFRKTGKFPDGATLVITRQVQVFIMQLLALSNGL